MKQQDASSLSVVPDSPGRPVKGQARQHLGNAECCPELSEDHVASGQVPGRGREPPCQACPRSVCGCALPPGTLAEGVRSLRGSRAPDPVIPLLGTDPERAISGSPRMASQHRAPQGGPSRDGAQPPPAGLYGGDVTQPCRPGAWRMTRWHREMLDLEHE